MAQAGGGTGGMRRRPQLIVLGLGLCVAIAGVSIAALSASPGSKSGPTAAGIGSPAPVASSSHAPAAPAAVTGHGLAKTVLRYPPRLKGQVSSWKAGRGGAALSAVTQQVGVAAQSAGLSLYAQMKLTCVSLTASIQAARAAPPIPDAAMQTRYGKALAELSAGAADCQQAISKKQEGVEDIAVHENKTLLNRSRSEFAVGLKQLYEATAAIGPLPHK